MTKQEKQKYLNKFKFIEKLNAYEPGWFFHHEFTCMKCKYGDPDGCTLIDRKIRPPALIYEDKIIKELKNKTLGNECVEFLRSPKKPHKSRK